MQENGYSITRKMEYVPQYKPRIASSAPLKKNRTFTFPDYIFYLLILLLPFEEITTIYGGSITKWIGLVFFFASLTNYKRYYGAFPKIFGVYIAYMLIGITVDFYLVPYLSESTFTEFSRPLLLLILMIVSYNLGVNGRLKTLVFVLFLSAVIFSIAQLIGIESESTVKERVGTEYFDRVAVFESNQNAAARYFALNILFGVVYGLNVIKSNVLFRVGVMASAGAGLVALIKTSSRGGLLALVVGVLCIIFTTRRLEKKAIYMVMIAVIVFSAGTYVMKDPLFVNRIEKSFYDKNTAGRTEIWSVGLSILHRSALFGFGTRMHMVALGQELGMDNRATHNTFIAVLMGTGVVGFAIFMYFYYQVMINTWRNRDVGLGSIVFVWFMMATAGAISMNMECIKWFFILMALALAVDKNIKNQLQQRQIQEVNRLRIPAST